MDEDREHVCTKQPKTTSACVDGAIKKRRKKSRHIETSFILFSSCDLLLEKSHTPVWLCILPACRATFI